MADDAKSMAAQVMFEARRHEEESKPSRGDFCCPLAQRKEQFFPDSEALLRHARHYHPDVAASYPDGTAFKSYLYNAAQKAIIVNARPHGLFPYASPDEFLKFAQPHDFSGSAQLYPLASPNRIATGMGGLSLDTTTGNPALGPTVPSKRAASRGPDSQSGLEPLDSGNESSSRKRPLGVRDTRYADDIDTRASSRTRRRQRAPGKKQRRSSRPRAPTAARADGRDLQIETDKQIDRESNKAQAPESAGKLNLFDLGHVTEESAMDSSTDTMDDDGGPVPYDDSSVELLLQPQTKAITLQQLEIEVNTIHETVNAFEARCRDEYVAKLAEARLPPEHRRTMSQKDFQVYIGLHKSFMQEIHDLCLATQHPVASDELRYLPRRINVPAKMWQFGIAAPLEILRLLLPESREHAITFILICFNMMALYYETVPDFGGTWLECLGDLARYRLGLAETDDRREPEEKRKSEEERETFSSIATYWFRRALDLSPQTGRLRHHLAVLIPNFPIEQLSLYGHSLTAHVPFFAARKSLLTSLRPALENTGDLAGDWPAFTLAFVRAHAALFVGGRGSLATFNESVTQIISGLFDDFVQTRAREKAGLKRLCCHVAIANSAALFEYGATTEANHDRSLLRLAFLSRHVARSRASGLGQQSGQTAIQEPATPTATSETLSRLTIAHAARLTFSMFTLALRRARDENLHPMIHVYFVMIWAFTSLPAAAKETEALVPWQEIVTFLNVWSNALTMKREICSSRFPHNKPANGQALTEDFMIQGLWFTQDYLPPKWCESANMDLQERLSEKESYVVPRLERILWLGYNIAQKRRFICYSAETKSFSYNNAYAQSRTVSFVPEVQMARELVPLYPTDSQQLAQAAPGWGRNASSGRQGQNLQPASIQNPGFISLASRWAEFRRECERFLANPPLKHDLFVHQQRRIGEQIAQIFQPELESVREEADEGIAAVNKDARGATMAGQPTMVAAAAQDKESLRQEMQSMIRAVNQMGRGKRSSGRFEIYNDHG